MTYNNTKGQALVEAVLILPLLFLILFGVLVFGIAIAEKQKLTYSTWNAAETGALTNSENFMNSAIQAIYSNFTEADSDVSATFEIKGDSDTDFQNFSGSENRYGKILRVILTKEYTLPFRVPFLELSDTMTFQEVAVTRIQCNADGTSSTPYVCEY